MLNITQADFGALGTKMQYMVRLEGGFDGVIYGNITGTGNYGAQLLIADKKRIKYRSLFEGVYGSWEDIVTKSDLSGTMNSTIIKRTQAGQAWVTASPTVVLEGKPGDNEALVLASLSTKDGKWNIGTQSNTNYLYFRYVASTGSVATYIIEPDSRTTKWL